MPFIAPDDLSPGVLLYVMINETQMRFVQVHIGQRNGRQGQVWNAKVPSPGWGVLEPNLDCWAIAYDEGSPV